jgi:hypothetical protein
MSDLGAPIASQGGTRQDTAVADLRADLDQLFLQAGRGPVPDRLSESPACRRLAGLQARAASWRRTASATNDPHQSHLHPIAPLSSFIIVPAGRVDCERCPSGPDAAQTIDDYRLAAKATGGNSVFVRRQDGSELRIVADFWTVPERQTKRLRSRPHCPNRWGTFLSVVHGT